MADVLVLCYHAVSPTWTVDFSVTPEALERQLTYLAQSGWRGVTFSEAVLDPPTGQTLAVTFDDAFASIKTYAAPVLARLGLPATVFAPTDYVSTGARLAWAGVEHWKDTPYAQELTPMTWGDLAELAASGWEVGSHTRTHPYLTQLGDEELRAELERSRADCSTHIGRPCDTIAYPYGDVDQRVADCARVAGYLAGAALSSRLERLGPLRWPRVGIFHLDAWWRFRLKAARPMRELRATRLWPRSR